jgi:hypothetical protein
LNGKVWRDGCFWRIPALSFAPHPTARIPTNPGIAPRIASKNSRSLAG